VATPTAHGAKDLPAAALLRAFLADDRQAGILLMETNGGRRLPAELGAEYTALLISMTKLAARCLLSANGYDPDRTLKQLDQWMTKLAQGEEPPGPPADPL
jgi:hypothetical protein